MFYERTMKEELQLLAKDYPVITVMGPRQSGKTTLVRAVFDEKPYANLEEPDQRLLATKDPRGFLAQFKTTGGVIDEVQHVPELLSYIQAIVDETDHPGMFILSGSHQMKLHEAITQSLAGRVGLLNLYPLTLNELRLGGIELTLEEQIYRGFYPRIYKNNLNATKTYSNYVQTYLEKDVRRISSIKDLVMFQNFMKLCAGRIGQILDYASLSNDLGVSANTVKNWISVLEASYIIFRLKPYFENFGKRIIKSPKLYFTDVGLATYLLDIENSKQIERDPMRGHLFENLVIIELVKYRYNRGLDPNLYYYRDNHKNEVDVIIKHANELIPIEIKSARTFNNDFLKGLTFYQNIAKERARTGYLVYAGELTQTINGVELINYTNTTKIYGSLSQ